MSLGRLIRAGARALADYTGTFLALYAVQALIALAAGAAIARSFGGWFEHRPLFDEGVDGDLIALIEALRDAPGLITAISSIAFGAILLWLAASWFLAGGLYAVLADRPHGRRETARTFGAGGASTFFVFLRLGVISLALHGLVLTVATIGLGVVFPTLERALTLGEALGALAAGLAPALLLLIVVWTVIDYARIDLVLQRRAEAPRGAVFAFARAVAFVVRSPIALGHALVWAAVWIGVSLLYVWASHGAAMLGTSGAIALLIVRQGLALVRMAAKVMLAGGQVELVSHVAACGPSQAVARRRAVSSGHEDRGTRH